MTGVESGTFEPSPTAWWQSPDGNWHPPADGRSYGLTGYVDSSGESVPDRTVQVLGFVTGLLSVLTISSLMDSRTKSAAFAIVAFGSLLSFVLTVRRARHVRKGKAAA
jgi:multisubunit Na+/H+ antiporter MnhF subunit